jgi:hypothetical protein
VPGIKPFENPLFDFDFDFVLFSCHKTKKTSRGYNSEFIVFHLPKATIF